SILITSAPRSPRICVATGPSTAAVRSMTRISASGPGIIVSLRGAHTRSIGTAPRPLRTTMISIPDPDDLERVKAWFRRLSEHVRAVDFAGAYPLFADDMIAFGTFENFVTGREAVERSESTRLNSSHRTISYAVFCLKKKKHPITYHTTTQQRS